MGYNKLSAFEVFEDEHRVMSDGTTKGRCSIDLEGTA